MTKVKLTYFKKSGKYYTEAHYESEFPITTPWEIYKEVRYCSFSDGRFPGLVSSHWEGFILVEPENCPSALIDL